MAEILRIDPDAVVGKLIRFWHWCDAQVTDESGALNISAAVIDRVTHQPGFSDALLQVSWLQARSGSLAIPNFDRHNGQTAKARAMENRKKASQRERQRHQSPKCPDDNGTNAGTKTGTREEKRREEKSNTTNPPPPSATAGESKDARHSIVTSRWGELYRGAFGSAYVFQGRDAATLKRFLATCKDDAEDVLTVAVQAWERTKQDRFASHCKQAATIHGLCTFYNDIRLELKTPSQASHDDRGKAGWA